MWDAGLIYIAVCVLVACMVTAVEAFCDEPPEIPKRHRPAIPAASSLAGSSSSSGIINAR